MLVSIFLVFGITTLVLLVILLLQMPIIYILIGRTYDKQFNKKSVFYDPGIIGYSFVIRMTSYASCVVFRINSRINKYRKQAYNSFDFRSDYTNNQVLLAKILVLFTFLFGFTLIATISLLFFVK